MVRPEDSPKLQVLLPFLWWGTFNIWSAIQKGKKDMFQSKYTHSQQNKPKRYIYKIKPEVIGYKQTKTTEAFAPLLTLGQ